MLNWLKSTIDNLNTYAIWLVLAILVTITGFQVHTTLIAVAIRVVQNPSIRPPGWTTNTIYGLSRLIWLILGIFWLGWVMFTEGYLSEGKRMEILKTRSLRLLLIIVAIYTSCYLVLR
ncbi:MAG TPA: hypothetical protein VLA49_19025 [Anaerolineales bacterium]|nr:hypothetical protein [Anaerolineales bacterium]